MSYLKPKAVTSIIFLLLIALIFINLQKVKPNDHTTVEEAMNYAGIDYDEIYYIIENIGNNIIFYGKDDIFSVGLVTKNRSKYQWIYGFGSKQFNETDQILTRAFTNLPTKESANDDELVSLTFGVINDEDIEELKIQYKDQLLRDATIIPTSKGPIWFCFSDTPVNYDPDVVRIYKNGETRPGWY